MKIKILEKNTNNLLDRLEVTFEVEAEAETPKRLEVKSKLAALINHDENLVIIKAIHQARGMKLSKGTAHAYKTEENLKRVEHEYLIKRNTLPAEKKE
ncbi:MAG: 30S ribosomal protein S24e [Candidatus Heimdallarchaeota archaeon]|nr:30S ribosomal protein S24e [Candidatus Heimdallarchaeota archaeon]